MQVQNRVAARLSWLLQGAAAAAAAAAAEAAAAAAAAAAAHRSECAWVVGRLWRL